MEGKIFREIIGMGDGLGVFVIDMEEKIKKHWKKAFLTGDR